MTFVVVVICSRKIMMQQSRQACDDKFSSSAEFVSGVTLSSPKLPSKACLVFPKGMYLW